MLHYLTDSSTIFKSNPSFLQVSYIVFFATCFLPLNIFVMFFLMRKLTLRFTAFCDVKIVTLTAMEMLSITKINLFRKCEINCDESV